MPKGLCNQAYVYPGFHKTSEAVLQADVFPVILRGMKNIPQHLASLAIAVWAGSLWTVGYLAVPVLFHAQPDRQLAGLLAGHMFSAAGYLGLFCGLYLLLYFLRQAGGAVLKSPQFHVVTAMLLIGLIFQFGFQPAMNELKAQALPLEVMNSAFAGQFGMLHGISSILYLAQSLLGVFLVIKSR